MGSADERRVVKAAKRLLGQIGPEAVARARTNRVDWPGTGGPHYLTNAAVVELADALARLSTQSVEGATESLSVLGKEQQ